ncbi:GNAT family N-acetyltransferase [Arthrobacter sp. NamB2]|uniref:GNAT family N-acetyltransferase n=1 Tax=Arthrobacter sp. NamB2 TaxID=2576035 RepID=UPI0010CA100E|nr:GNAT family N-acetyltransferase [Arthrobacter sp. NamB2]TKV27418.1 GNAT family N-acetyltransferase [Arthrobacter sp. NamB2]
MELRLLSESDKDQALLAHRELAAEQFDFLFSYDDGLDWVEYLEKVEDTRQGRNLPAEHVPATFLIAEVDGDLVGRISIRHSLNPFLRTVGGHIGYAVRPQFSKRGYAQQILKLALVEAKQLGIDQVLLTCDSDNYASKATIENNGGVLEAPRAADSATTVKLRYWIDT